MIGQQRRIGDKRARVDATAAPLQRDGPAGSLFDQHGDPVVPGFSLTRQPERSPRTDIPDPDRFLPFLEAACHAVFERLSVGAERYGEEVLFILGEPGAVVQCYTKAARALWSYKNGHPEESRDDTWIDLAGYAILEVARKAYARGLLPGDIDGLFDRGTKRGGTE